MDRSLFPRLKRLFSTDVVIRNVGGKQLRVIDIDHAQAYGGIQTNTLIDRYTRIHLSNRYNHFNPTLNYQTLRLQLYSDYEAMDTDAIISSVLDMISEDCTTENEKSEILSVKSSNENIQKILQNLFYSILNIDFNLAMWIRSMCKYGDFYLKLDIAEEYGVYNAKPLSVYDIIREEGVDPSNPSYVRYTYDPMALAGGVSSISKSKLHYENYEVGHFRLISDSNYLPYGRSYIEPARKLFKQLTLLEDAALIHRIMRAPEKRVFYYNIGSLAPNEVDALIQKQIENTKKIPYIDQNTGEYNLKFNIQNMIEDYHIPVRNGDNVTKIDTAKGLEYAGMDDIEYLRDKLLAALKTPKAFLNYSDELNGKSTISALDVRWARSIGRIQKVILSELTKIAIIHLYVQGFDDGDLVNFELKLNNPSIILEQEKIALLKEKVDLANQITEKNLLSTDYIYAHIFNLSEDEYNSERELIIEDVKRKFQLSQIENEGNDPTISNVSYGTPHDLASQYGDNTGADDVPDGYDEKENDVGRPKKHMSIYGTQDAMGGRDVIGKKGMKDIGGSDKLAHKYKGGPMALESMKSKNFKGKAINLHPSYGKKILLYKKNEDKKSILDESNIKDTII